MDTTLNSILFSILITVTPIFYAYYKKEKATYLITSMWGIISFIITLLPIGPKVVFTVLQSKSIASIIFSFNKLPLTIFFIIFTHFY